MAVEHTGTVVKAAEELAKSGKKVFKVAVREGDKDWEYTLFDPAQIQVATDNKGKLVKIVADKPDKYWNLQSIEPVTEEQAAVEAVKQNGREQSIAQQVAVKVVAELWAADKLGHKDSEVLAMRRWVRSTLATAEPQHKTREQLADEGPCPIVS